MIVRSEDIVGDVLFFREEGKRGFGREFVEDRYRVDNLVEGVIENSYFVLN